MNRKDQTAATNALIDWFASQDISMEEAVPILSVALVGAIFTLAQKHDKDPDIGMRLMAEGMVQAMKMRTKQ